MENSVENKDTIIVPGYSTGSPSPATGRTSSHLYQILQVDEEGKVMLSDGCIEKIAQRVLQLLKEKL